METPAPFEGAITSNDENARAFRHGIRIRPDEGALLRTGSTNIPLGKAEAGDFAPLILKDLAVYDISLGGGGTEREELFQAMWNLWVPLRDRRRTGELVALEPWTVRRACPAVLFTARGGFDTHHWRQLTLDHAEHIVAVGDAGTRAGGGGGGGGGGAGESGQRAMMGSELLASSPTLREALGHLVAFHEELCATVPQQTGQGEKDRNVPDDLQLSFTQLFAVADAYDWETFGWTLCCRKEYAREYGLSDEANSFTIQGKETWVAWRAEVKSSAVLIFQELDRARTTASQ